MPTQARLALVLQITSDFGNITLSSTPPSRGIQVPVVDEDFLARIRQLALPKTPVDLEQPTEKAARAAAEAALPAATPGATWTLAPGSVAIDSCLVHKDWKPCETTAPGFGFEVLYNGASVMVDPLVHEADRNDRTTLQLALAVIILVQVL